MKPVKYFLGIFVIAVLMTSCYTTRDNSTDEYDGENVSRIGNRIYVDDPYYGRVVLERDPFTGRYYDVTYGSRGYSSFNGFRGYRGYPRYYNSYPRNYNNSNSGNVQRPSLEQVQKNREEARNKVLGNNKKN